MKSGMLAAEAIYPLLTANGESGTIVGGAEYDVNESIEATAYEKSTHKAQSILQTLNIFPLDLDESWVGEELRVIRNAHGSFHSPLGQLGGMIHTAFSCFISKGKEPWTFKNDTIDADKTKPAAQCEEIKYPKPDGVLSFDLLTNLQRSGISTYSS